MAATERKYDLYGADFRADPHRVFARMREADPVLRQPGLDGETPIWFVTRHEDVAAVLMDDERFVRDPRLALTEEELAAQPTPPAIAAIENHMLNRDGEDHRRLRRLVTKAFTPKMVEQLRPRIQAIADELLDAVEPRGEMDLSAEYAFPLPITVIAEMLGVPARGPRSLQGVVGRDHLPRARGRGAGAVLRPDGRVRRLPDRLLRRPPC